MKKEKIILPGDRPTGKLHIGHYVGSLRRRVELQNSGLYDKIFVFVGSPQGKGKHLSRWSLLIESPPVFFPWAGCWQRWHRNVCHQDGAGHTG